MPQGTFEMRRHGIAGRDKLRRSRAVWGLAVSLLVFSSGGRNGVAAHESGSTERFLSLHEEPLTAYRGWRRMHAVSDRFNQEGWLDAWTEFDQQGFRYRIVSERGSEYVRNKVLRSVLQREQELIAAGDNPRATLTAANYEFQDAVTEAFGERYVLLKPRRKDVLLVEGRMVLSQDGSELLRVEGRLSKNPSFWTSLVNVIRHYARLDGVRVPTLTESEARLKFGGVAHLDVRYDYDTINGRPVGLAARAAR